MKSGRRKRKTKRRQRDRRAVQAKYLPPAVSPRLRDLRRQDNLRRALKNLGRTAMTSMPIRIQAVTTSSPVVLRVSFAKTACT